MTARTSDVGQKRPHNRLFIFGWDAADWVVIQEAWRRGRLSNLQKIADRGQQGTLLSTEPPITSLAWTSFLTGAEPGSHGIFGFRSIDAEYRISPVPGGARRVPTLFRALDERGIRTASVTVPWTYPPEELQVGAVVPGWDAPNERADSTHPPELAVLLAEAVPRVPRRIPAETDAESYLLRQARDIQLRETISDLVLERHDPQVFMLVFIEPDRAGHHLWPGGPVPDALMDSYDQVDAAMGRLLDRWASDEDTVLVVSDHGTRPVHTIAQVAPLLAEEGWLAMNAFSPSQRASQTLKKQVWNRTPPRLRNRIWRSLPRRTVRKAKRAVRSGTIDWSRTAVFPLGNEPDGIGVFVNLQSRYSKGSVKDSEYEALRERVADHLSSVRHPTSDEPIFHRVARREDSYAGSAAVNAPDLLLIPRPGFGAGEGRDFTSRIATVATGGHRPEGIFAVSDHLGLREIERIEDILPRVLEARELLPGASWLPSGGDRKPIVTAAPGYSIDEAAEMEERLRALGYVE